MNRIDPLLLGAVTLPADHPRAGASCVVLGYVIHHAGGPILVDTGVPRGNPVIEELFSPADHPLDEALAGAGVERGDVVMVINSHLHFDHCGGNRLFPDIPLVVQRAEHRAAQQAGYAIPEWIDFPGARWELVEGNRAVAVGVSVLATPGHTPGHQSVVVSDGAGLEIIAAQALYDPDELDAEASIEELEPADAAATASSARTIKSLAPRRVYFSHDRRVWEPTA